MKKNILFIIPTLNGGGSERIVSYLLKYLDRNKFSLSIALFEKEGVYLKYIPKDVKIFNLKKKLKLDVIKYMYKLNLKVIPEINPDIIISFLDHTNILTIISKLFHFNNFKVIVSQRHNINKNFKANYLIYNLVKMFYPFADIITCLSSGIVADLKKLNIPAKKLKILHNGVNTNLIKANLKNKIDFKTPTIISCGRLTKVKNFPLLLNAFKLVLKNKKCQLIILGKGPDEKVLKEYTHKLKIQKQVNFLGFKENPFKFLNAADIFVLSSEYEGFGNVILEAMTCKTPVISTKTSGAKDIIINDFNGIILQKNTASELAKKINYLLENKKVGEKLIQNSQKTLKQFSLQKMIKNYESLFFSI
ncbi:MAG: glycosyltransferase [Candidatus Muiribacteriota bacterium]